MGRKRPLRVLVSLPFAGCRPFSLCLGASVADLMAVAGKKVLVVGAARSGIASASFLARQGAMVALNDRQPIEKWSEGALALKSEGVGLIPGEVPGWLLDQLELVVMSPSVPPKSITLR